MAELKTYGDLKKAIEIIQLKQKGEKIGGVAVDTILGAIPGVGAAKTTFDFIKAAFSKPDTKKTNSWLDKLDIDDEMSAIVDDTVENGFLQMMSKTIDSKPDTDSLESDFNMNDQMVDYLKKEYSGRTVSGVQENIKEQKLRQLIREEIQKTLHKDATRDIKTLQNELGVLVEPLYYKDDRFAIYPDLDTGSKLPYSTKTSQYIEIATNEGKYFLSRMFGHDRSIRPLAKLINKEPNRSSIAGMSTLDISLNKEPITISQLKRFVNIMKKGLSDEASAQADFYKNRQPD